MITGLGHTPLAETYLELSSFKGDDKIELDNENRETLCILTFGFSKTYWFQ